ncbi:MAG: alcohol dehydrogenase catalytic domain-containing protein [Nocardiopsaceae bacterium]|nr:alcohol dehydrogenase catalytic domain-containing protein [Nocardiopsaceae bacterium]
MIAAVLERAGTVAIRDVPAPRAANGLALVRVGQAGVCGTDVKIAAGEIPVPDGRVLGHEMTGWVEVPGRHGDPPAGTAVMVNPAVFCGRCDLCRRDLPQLCRNGGLLGRDADGCFAELVAVDEALLHPIPGSVTADAGALLQVLSTCVHAQSALHSSPDDSAVVIGLGVTGLLHLQLLRARGLRTVIGVTGSEWKRDLARRLGASTVASSADGSSATAAGAVDAAGVDEVDEVDEAIADATGGRGARFVIDCAGTPATFAQAVRLAGAGGTIVAFGINPRVTDVTPYEWYIKELTIHSPRAAGPRDCDTAIELCARGQLDVGPLVTGRFPLSRLADALAATRDPAQLKVVVDVDSRVRAA